MSTKQPTYEELKRRLAEAEQIVRTFRDREANASVAGPDEHGLRMSEEKYKNLVENIVDIIFTLDTAGYVTSVNASVRAMLGFEPEEIIGKHFTEWIPRDQRPIIMPIFKRILAGETITDETVLVRKDGAARTVEFRATSILREGRAVGVQGILRDVTERQQREDELRKMNEDLVLASRRAGMAEVATDVLHNVGNVLNSINVSASFIEDKVMSSKVVSLKKVIDLLAEHPGDLGTFLTEDGRGKHIPMYLTEAARLILDEQAAITEKLKSLMKNVEHVTHIIQAQQSYARSGGVETFTNIHEVIEDAVEINHSDLERYGIDLRYQPAELPRIRMDKQRVLQILVNLLTNAKQALFESEKQRKVLTIRSYRHGGDKLRIEVTDNGIGIPKENMPRIFKHGFTTKKSGHGFGLHGSDLAAREMGGSLTARSDGPGHGATFTLELPLQLETVTDGFYK